ncbi:unnamed protein product [Clonostachys rhizophaga]|uniref:Uncharacterized protein n=1 Tax=Clonostachys rhizophaga TaxID=160324 RepID=A0A9N9V3Y0_9HYPO|nr:unnamed protein product [Clonostachys rhizophaga]
MAGPPKHDSACRTPFRGCARLCLQWLPMTSHGIDFGYFSKSTASLIDYFCPCRTSTATQTSLAQFGVHRLFLCKGSGQGPGPRTIDSITEALLQAHYIVVNENYEAYQSAKELVFNIVGWQTMLYRANNLTRTTDGLSILDEIFILGFGMMLPQKNYYSFDDTEDRKLFNAMKLVNVKEINAHVLYKVCGVKIQWADRDFVSLSICFILRCEPPEQEPMWKLIPKPVIQCCGVDASSSLPWANEADINDLLREVLLSYRLLFGQSRRSRKLFRRLRPFAQTSQELHDRFLFDMCTKKEPKCSINLIEHEQYDLVGDFPHLRSRLMRLNNYATAKKPRSVRQLWKDKRDSTACLAFWSVIIIGSIGILLGLIQTVLQIMQYTLTIQQGK